MRLAVKNKLTMQRALIVIVIVFLESFLAPMTQILQGDRMPTIVELARCLSTAALQVVTMMMGLLQVAKPEEEEEAKAEKKHQKR